MRSIFTVLILVSVVMSISLLAHSAPPVENPREVHVNTFSIVAYDPEQKEWGVGVASKYLAVGSAVPWAKAGVGAVATQASVNVEFGEKGLALLAEGKSAEEVVKTLTDGDKGKNQRQLGVIDAKGEAANFTGTRCLNWAGGRTGNNYTCQGNILAGEEVITKMGEAFEGAKGPLCWRMMAALEAADKAGGDKRGKQSAAILVVKEKGGPNGFGDRHVDLRVDDHETPLVELSRILNKRIKKPAE